MSNSSKPVAPTQDQPVEEVATVIVDELPAIGEFATVPMNLIEVGDVSLRPAQTESPEFKQLQASIAKEGLNTNVLVTPSEMTPGKLMLVDGLQRLTIMQMLGATEMPVKVVDSSESKIYSQQIQANIHRVTTKPAEFGQAIRRMMQLNTGLTVTDLANELNLSVGYITDRIGLKALLPEIAKKVDEGEITASAAFKLCKLPQDEQLNFVGRAATLPIEQFTDQVETRLGVIKEARNKGVEVAPEVFIAIPRLRKKNEIVDESQKHGARAELVVEGVTPAQAFDAAIDWALQLDPVSVNIEREKWEAEQAARKARAEAREAAKLERDKAKAANVENAAAAAIAAAG